MDPTRLDGRRVLLTHADVFMGPVLQEVLKERGAEVIADTDPLLDPSAPARMVAAAGSVDVLLVHLAVPAPSTRVEDVDEAEWRRMFDCMVDPLPRLARAMVPQMKARGSGKILVIGSASALRGMKRASAYSPAQGAQLAWVQSPGVELAPLGIQVNAIAQNFVDNPTYFPPEVQELPAFKERLRREVPLGRLVSAREDAYLCAYLASSAADCFVGQAIPLSGGWAAR